MSGCTVFVFLSLMEYALINIVMGDIADIEKKKSMGISNLILGSTKAGGGPPTTAGGGGGVSSNTMGAGVGGRGAGRRGHHNGSMEDLVEVSAIWREKMSHHRAQGKLPALYNLLLTVTFLYNYSFQPGSPVDCE